jgi:D-alanyl-D-alanine-carboxypeptidase/D-alanyl-D-alanine-endopeptidase
MGKCSAVFAGLMIAAMVPAPVTGQPAAANSVEAVVPAIDAHFQRYMADSHVPGLVYGIVRDGQLQHIGTFGVQDLESRRPVGPETLFRIASMSKAFTALAILKLRDEGKLSLDDLAETYVPEMRGWRYPTSDSPHISVRDLLSHVAGFVTDDPWGDRQTPLPEPEFTRMLKQGVPFTRAPGTAYEYSNFGFALLGRIVTNASGRPFEDYIQQEIMRPLGMTSTGYDIFSSPQARRAIGYRWENDSWAREPDMKRGAFGAMGGVQTSATDYARWVDFLLSGWPARDGPELGPVRRSTVRELAEGLNFVQLTTRPGKSDPNCALAVAYGKGMRVGTDCKIGTVLGHGGGYPGYGSYVLLLPEYGVGVFAFANRTYAGPTPAVWDAAMELNKAGWFKPRTVAVSAPLATAYVAAGAMYREGRLDPGRSLLAMNFPMDRTAKNWMREFSRLKQAVGDCRTDAPITATGLLAGRFTWSCARGRLEGDLLLAPTRPPAIQALHFNPMPIP